MASIFFKSRIGSTMFKFFLTPSGRRYVRHNISHVAFKSHYIAAAGGVKMMRGAISLAWSKFTVFFMMRHNTLVSHLPPRRSEPKKIS